MTFIKSNYMRIKLFLFFALSLIGLTSFAKDFNGKVFVVEAGNGDDLLKTIKEANTINSPRTYVFLPAGTYDLGKNVLNLVAGKNICFIGEGMDKTVIVNSPDVENEGISKTATLLITGDNNYFQDLTIQNAMDYYSTKGAGRAVCIQDMGTNNIFNRVRLLSHQDTYYPKNGLGEYYWKDSEIHGTVDFICGRGAVYFDQCKIVVEKRSVDGKGGCVIAAPNTSKDFGMVFYGCTIENHAESYSLARSWGAPSICHYVNTTLLDPARITESRFTTAGMNCIAERFIECNSMDTKGNVISPKSNKLSFHKGENKSEKETIESADSAQKYKVENVLPNWRPDIKLKELESEARSLMPKK